MHGETIRLYSRRTLLDATTSTSLSGPAFMPISKKCTSLSTACYRILWLFFAILGVFLGLVLVHRGVLPIFAWLFPQCERFFYDIAVFGAYRTHKFVSFDLPPPHGIFAQQSDQCDGGDIFFGPNGKSVSSPGPMITNSQGELIWMSNDFDVATNIQVQQFNGQNYLTFWAGHKKGSLGQGTSYMLDSKYDVAYKIQAVGEGLHADLHEFQLTNDGSAIITFYNKTTADLRSMGRGKDGWIEDSGFQEIDIATGELLFQWRAKDHFKPEYTYYWNPFAGYVRSVAIDFYHLNSIEKDSKGNYLICSRHFHHVAYLNGTTGKPIWSLGGGPQLNQFTDLSDGMATGFKWQHHARWLSEEDQIITVMDNGNAGPLHMDAPYSKGLIIQIDTEAYTAKVLQEYKSLTHAKSASQGSLQKLSNGNMLVGWGSAAAWSEYDGDGDLLCEAHFAASWLFWWERAKNYRTFKHRGWVGRPVYPPAAKIKDSRVYVSWNGATEVKQWELQGSMGGQETFESIEVIGKHKFEESFIIPSGQRFQRFRVVALDDRQQALASSEPVEPEAGSWFVGGLILGISIGVIVLLGIVGLLRKRARRKGERLLSWEREDGIFGHEYHYTKL